MARLKQTMRLVSSDTIAPKVLQITLQPESEFDYIPGQFITIHFDEARRSYSIANPPDNSDNIIEFAISYQAEGVASEELFNKLQIGDTVEVSGPAGRLTLLENHPERYVLIATGTGVTPYRAMLNQIEEIMSTHNTKFLLLFGVRNLDECLYIEEFKKFKQKNPNFDFQVYFSREVPELDFAHQGYVQSGLDNHNLNPEKDMIYLCGNPNMIDEAFPILTTKGFTAKTVRREKYISSK